MLLLIVFTIIGFNQFVASFTCTDDCLSKAYCLSADGSSTCSGNIYVQVKFSVIQQPGSYDRLHIILSGYGIKSLEEININLTLESLKFESIKVQTIYTCYKSSLGATKSIVFQKDSNSTFTFGSSYYSNEILSCNWIFSKYDKIWPMLNNKPIKMIDDDQYSITLDYGSVSAIVAHDLSELPIYKMHFLHCCNKIHGSGKYLFTFSQSDDEVDYLVQIFDPNPLETTISLKNSRGNQLIFSCLFATVAFNAKIVQDDGDETKINDQLVTHYIGDSRCSWSTLLHLNCTRQLNLLNDVYNLQITSGNVVVYMEDGVTLKNSCSSLSTKHFVLITLTIMLIGQSLFTN